MNHQSAAGAKSELRQSLTLARNLARQLPENTKDSQFASNLRQLCLQQSARVVACYLSFGPEPSTLGFLKWAHQNQLRVLLPISLSDGELNWVESNGEETREGIFGFAEAVGPIAELSNADLILVPALAVDRSGNRLGKGKGYYDRALANASSTPTYAVVFDSEVIDQIPAEIHDVKISGFVTESRIVPVAI